MTDTLWSDISYFQNHVNDSYPYATICIRSNDGSFLDPAFPANHDWCKSRRASGKLFCFLVYYFFRPGVNGASILMNRVGKPDPRLVVMIDVESAGGQVHGDNSSQINHEHDQLAHWLGDSKRVVGYGNVSDLNALWPHKPSGIRLVVAAYGSNPGYPGKYAHQFTDKANTKPFGPSDLNSADGMTHNDLLKLYGFTPTSPPKPQPQQAAGTSRGPTSKPTPGGGTDYYWHADGSMSLDAFMARRNSKAMVSIAVTQRTGSDNDKTAMQKYVSAGTSHNMPNDMVFFTDNG